MQISSRKAPTNYLANSSYLNVQNSNLLHIYTVSNAIILGTSQFREFVKDFHHMWSYFCPSNDTVIRKIFDKFLFDTLLASKLSDE